MLPVDASKVFAEKLGNEMQTATERQPLGGLQFTAYKVAKLGTYERYGATDKFLQQLKLGKAVVNAMMIGGMDCKFAVEEVCRWCGVEAV